MHRCWKVPELTSTIFKQLGDRPDGAWEALCALARTCRAFSEPALDLLWKEQASLVPLLKCLPSGTWQDDGEVFVGHYSLLRRFVFDGSQEICSLLHPAHWDRVVLHSRRIKAFGFCDSDIGYSTVNESTMRIILMSFPLAHVLPNVRSVRIFTSSVHFPYSRLLFGPLLAEFYITVEARSLAVSALARLADWPSLTHFDLDTCTNGVDHDVALTIVISSYIQAAPFNSLETLSIQYLSPSACRHLASLPRLKSLTIERLHGTSFRDIHSLQQGRWFPKLDTLFLYATHLMYATNFLQAIQTTPLRRLFVSARGCSRDEFRSCLSAVQHQTSLTFLKIDLRRHLRPPPLPVILTAKDLTPLLSLPQIRTLSFLTSDGISFDDSFGNAMSLAWPQIKTVELGDSRTHRDPNRVSPTTETLVSFARNCPHLEGLTLRFDLTGLSVDSASPACVRQMTLKAVDFDGSHIDEPLVLAKILSSLFPALRSVRSPPNSEPWGKVKELVAAFAVVREDERRFMNGGN
ncbi:hypothetical protein FB45DRAFT_1141058 [Roridomyces roridus]|uniref:F-box domain-containing protein n=1 Tax=Roridomyces roridus TaxID=1738132 RepID=A0AAD7F6S2_9AGAR|nr:hypothetical protein FB45DRAFT_1141058 [Roridomyces roridus]